MEEIGFNYYCDTSPEEFLADLRAILVDGDNLRPVRLIEEVNYMTSQFIEAQIAKEDK